MDFAWIETLEGWQELGDGSEFKILDGAAFVEASQVGANEDWRMGLDIWGQGTEVYQYEQFPSFPVDGKWTLQVVRLKRPLPGPPNQ